MSTMTSHPGLVYQGIRFEATKTVISRAWWISAAIIMVMQPLLSFISGTQLAQTGVDATMESDPSLLAPLPPLEYFGFDAILLGQLVIVVLGALAGAADYVNGEFRTTLLAINSRSRVVVSKLASFSLLTFLLSGVSSYFTIWMQHQALGDQGLPLPGLTPLVWSLLLRSTLATTCLGLIAYCLALMLRSRVVSLLILVPQIVGPGTLLMELWAPAGYLPGTAAGLVFAAPTDGSAVSATAASVALLVWTVAAVAATGIVVGRRDVGAR